MQEWRCRKRGHHEGSSVRDMVVGQGGGCGDREKGVSLRGEIDRMDVAMDDLPEKAAVKVQVLNGQSGWVGRGKGGAARVALARPFPPNSWCVLMSTRHFLPPNGGM